MLNGVRCTVSDCNYWRDGNYCDAKEILITHDWVGKEYPNSVDAAQVQQIVAQAGGTPAHQCYDTCCKTFEPRKRS
ncbi:MAG: DUF1540 domain-containing protein [Clostridia bacterium]|nr:DUF1540 domain-containing protein [Clostridia bacterium]